MYKSNNFNFNVQAEILFCMRFFNTMQYKDKTRHKAFIIRCIIVIWIFIGDMAVTRRENAVLIPSCSNFFDHPSRYHHLLAILHLKFLQFKILMTWGEGCPLILSFKYGWKTICFLTQPIKFQIPLWLCRLVAAQIGDIPCLAIDFKTVGKLI